MTQDNYMSYLDILFGALGHDVYRDEETMEIDSFAFSVETCNGPVCKVCYASICVHCDTTGESIIRLGHCTGPILVVE